MGDFFEKLIYFILAVVGFGSAGIWMPVFLDWVLENETNAYSIYQNCTTYFISLLFVGCLSLIKTIVNGSRKFKMAYILILILIILLSIGVTILSGVAIVKLWDGWAFNISLFGVIAAWSIWWISHVSTSSNPYNALGGETTK